MKHGVFVAGKRFLLISDDKEEYVQNIAKEVNDQILKITTTNPTLDSRACALLCALDQADDKYKEIAKNQRFAEKAKDVMTQADKHAKTIVELKNEIKNAKELNKKQLQEIADKNVEIKKLTNNVKELSSENEKLKEEIKRLKNQEKRPQENKPNFTKKPYYQNPVAKVNSPDKTKQMTFFENE